MFDVLADSARLRAEDHADLIIAFPLRDPAEHFSLAVFASLAQTTNRRMRIKGGVS